MITIATVTVSLPCSVIPSIFTWKVIVKDVASKGCNIIFVSHESHIFVFSKQTKNKPLLEKVICLCPVFVNQLK